MRNSKKILFVNQSSGYLMYDLVNSEVFDSFDEKVFFKGSSKNEQKELRGHVKVINTIRYNNSTVIKRFFTWFIASIHLWLLILLKYRKHHIFFTSNPPISHFIGAIIKLKFSVLVLDVYPDVLIRSRIFGENHFLITAFKKLNSKIYYKAKKVYTLSEGMKNVLMQYVNESQIEVIPLWGDDDNLKKINKRENEFLKRLGISDKFILLYSGNMGLTHPIEVLVKLAEALNNTNIHILAIGGGPKYRLLQEFAEQKLADNITVLPWQDRQLLSEIISGADLGVVTSDSSIADISVPSKLFNLLKLNVPILAVGHTNSELNLVVQKFHIGGCFNEGEVENMKEFIIKCYSESVFWNTLVENTKIADKFFNKSNLLNIKIQ